MEEDVQKAGEGAAEGTLFSKVRTAQQFTFT